MVAISPRIEFALHGDREMGPLGLVINLLTPDRGSDTGRRYLGE